ncbi:hypothetical protein EKO27_g2057 [Xylaria grammica]|uniref:Uncharacterized protein n=1 Tax=Xylaria grammica TaxID=363999 RepID=A0A439DF59_9PEZI|nr:hypothetical protein EKO27_g2057 [Xylaria grammica]
MDIPTIGLGVAIAVLGIVVVGLRFYTRYNKQAGLKWDDWLILVSLLLALATDVLVVYSNSLYPNTDDPTEADDLGVEVENGPEDIISNQFSFAATVLYFSITSTTKLSILLLYNRLFSVSAMFRRQIIVLSIVVIGYGLGSTIAHTLSCVPLEYYWDRGGADPRFCFNYNIFWFATGICEALIDVLLLLLPIGVVAKLQLSTKKKVAMGSVFVLGALLNVTSNVGRHRGTSHNSEEQNSAGRNGVAALQCRKNTPPIGKELYVSYFRPPPSQLFIPRPSGTRKPHVYQRLPQGHARLLRRVPQPDKNELIFEFASLSISGIGNQGPGEPPPKEYIAISYCWGNSPADQVLVLADGSTVPITKKVVNILEVILGQVPSCDTVWLDAICINQQDPVEKSEQIALMPGIYHRAISVEIFLATGWASMQAMCEAVNSRNMPSGTIFRAGLLRPVDSYSVLTPYTNDEIIEIMWSPWFERAWVIQEYCYSRKANFHYRQVVMNELFLEKVYGWGNDLAFGRIADSDEGRVEVPIPPMIQHFGGLITMRREISQRALRQNPLEDVLCRFYHCKATDPHDKVIAFLGLANGRLLKEITADYGRPPAALYLEAMIAMMRQSTDYALLGFAGIASRRPLFKDNPDVPSWLPDLSAPPNYTTWSCQWQRFNASGIQENAGVRALVLDSEEAPGGRQAYFSSHVILTRGTCIGTLVGGVRGNERHNFASLPEFITAALDIMPQLSSYPTGESARDILWKTLIAANPLGFKRDKSGTGGYIGLAANEIEPGDEVWVLAGARVPFILRHKARHSMKKEESDDSVDLGVYDLVTEAYVHGVMKGEVEAMEERT